MEYSEVSFQKTIVLCFHSIRKYLQLFFSLFIGVHLKDLIAVDNALPDYVSDKKLINFQKMVKFYGVIATLMNFKNMQPPAPSKFELINMLRVSRRRIECGYTSPVAQISFIKSSARLSACLNTLLCACMVNLI